MSAEGFTRSRFPNDDSGREVVTVGDPKSSRPVVLLHELGGLSQPTMDYAAMLTAAKCVVHMPLVFGSVGQGNKWKGAVQLCWGRQLTLLLSDRRPKLAGWLAEFSRHIFEGAGHAPVVIGMCATGGVVFSVVMLDSVGGAVAAQPSLPIRTSWTTFSKSNLGSTSADVEASIASGKPFVALRFQQDGMCPAGRLTKIAELFGEDSTLEINGGGHSTLVYEYSEEAHAAVLALLDEVFGPAVE
jgi:dienelactone hydrolase